MSTNSKDTRHSISLSLFRTAHSSSPKSSFKTILTCVLVLTITTVFAGCASIRYGGAPEPSFDVDKDLEQLAKQFEPAASISEFYKKPSREARDNFIMGRITMMNIRYVQFIRNLTSEKALLDTAVAMVTLGLNLAGASVAAASTKTVLAAISAGLVGSKEAIDKNYFFDKTIPALVSQMNAERKKALIPLLVGSKQELDEYSFAQAVTDLNNYYFAGTFAGAIQGIQVEAAAKEERQDDIIATLTPLTKEAVVHKQTLTEAINALGAPDIPKIDAAFKTLSANKTITPLFDEGVKSLDPLIKAKAQLQGYVRAARTPPQIDVVTKAFKEAGIKQ